MSSGTTKTALWPCCRTRGVLRKATKQLHTGGWPRPNMGGSSTASSASVAPVRCCACVRVRVSVRAG